MEIKLLVKALISIAKYIISFLTIKKDNNGDTCISLNITKLIKKGITLIVSLF